MNGEKTTFMFSNNSCSSQGKKELKNATFFVEESYFFECFPYSFESEAQRF